jgi:FAD:protein FMN transferase
MPRPRPRPRGRGRPTCEREDRGCNPLPDVARRNVARRNGALQHRPVSVKHWSPRPTDDRALCSAGHGAAAAAARRHRIDMTTITGRPIDRSIGLERWSVWSTIAMVAVDPPDAIDAAAELLRLEIAAFDLACNRFRFDSEVSVLNHLGRTRGPASPLFMEALESALRGARVTDGAVDPTVGRSLLALGYDCDYRELRGRPSDRPLLEAPAPAPGWHGVRLDERERRVELPPGVVLDLGATAKALCVDRAAQSVAQELGVGVVVNIGGDLAVAGPPPRDGWLVSVRENSSDERADDQCSVSVFDGGLATSGTSVRRWTRAGREIHHIVDPRTGWPAPAVWVLVTVSAASCLDANTASTAAIVWGHEAPFRLAQFGLPARFVGADGQVIEVGGWPAVGVGAAPGVADGARP